MARRVKVRYALQRSKVDAAVLAIADGAVEWAKQSVEEAGRTAPDSPYLPWPKGEGLPKQGGVLAYWDGRRIAAWGLDGKSPRAPRAAKISRTRGLVLIMGWGFPARFNEFGTVKMHAQPFVARGFFGAMGAFESVAGAITRAKLKVLP
jgi:hypothetical protein